MSDPVTNHDIEDVLSSIRRLVAQGDPRRMSAPANAPTQLHPRPAVTPAKEDVSEAAKPAERLVLTPAFRVLDKEDDTAVKDETPEVGSFDAATSTPESDVIPTKDPRPIPAPAQSPSERASLEATIAELEAAVNSRTDEWEPDGSEVSFTDSFTSVFLNKLDAVRPRHYDDEDEIDETEVTLNDVVNDHIAGAVTEEIEHAFPHLTAADEAPIDEAPETVVPLMVAEPIVVEPTVVDAPVEMAAFRAAANQTTPVEKMTPAAEVVDVPEVDVSKVDVSEVEAPQNDVSSARPVSGFVDPVIFETPTFRHSSFQEVYDPVAEATADAAEAAPDAAEMYGDDLAPDPVETSTAVADPVNTPLMDPDMLRDMVGKMIREELQGEMGERITRNVRKLVRREINRVISAQEFD